MRSLIRVTLVPFLSLAVAASLAGCGDNHAGHDDGGAKADAAPAALDPASPNPDPNCQPINAVGQPDKNLPGECFLPYPSAYYEKEDATTISKWRLNIPTGVLPKNQVGKDFVPASYNRLDGWSPSTSLVANLRAPIDPAQLPKGPFSIADVDKIGDTAKADSRIQLMEYTTGERVAVWAEVDANSPPKCTSDEQCGPGRSCLAGACLYNCQDSSDCRIGGTCDDSSHCTKREDQVLLIHPLKRLKPATRYVVALVGIVDTSGKPIVVAPFQQLVDQKFDQASPLAKVSARYEEIFTALGKYSVERSKLTYAWDFVTGSNEQYSRWLIAMRDAAFKRFDQENLGGKFAVEEVKMGDPNTPDGWLSQIVGTLSVPNFLTSTTDLYAGLKFDANYMPVDTGQNYPALVHINVPKCVTAKLQANEKIPVLVYGHGLLGGPGEADGGVHQSQANLNCHIYVATNWVGLSNADSGPITAKVFSEWENFRMIPERLQQGQLNFLVLAHWAATTLKDLPGLRTMGGGGGAQIVDEKQIWYYGISQGGIEGNILVATSPDIRAGVFGVGAGNYSFLITRSSDFKVFDGVLSATYAGHRDQALLLAISQNLWDYADPIAYGARITKDTFPGLDGKPMAPKRALLMESRYDAQVSNLGSHQLAHELGVPLLEPYNYKVYGLPSAMGPVESAYVQFDDSPRWKMGWDYKQPDINIPAVEDNPAHEAVRRWPAAQEMIRRFLRVGGKVENTCDGKCDANVMAEWPNGEPGWK